jgi:uncharacterized cupredoxin-like copper-binding protein
MPREDDPMASLRTSPLFTLVVLLAFALFGCFGFVLFGPPQVVALLGPATAAHVTMHFRNPAHRVHDLTFAFLLGTAGLGLLAQLRNPDRNAAAQVMAVVPFVALTLVAAVTNASVLQLPWIAVGAVTLLATSLHPTGRGLLGSFGASRASPPMLALVALSALPLVAYTVASAGLQRTVADEHALLGHYGFTAAFAVTILAVGLLASLRPDGWWLPAWVAGALPALLGVVSLLARDAESGLSLPWAVAAIAWGVAFVAVAELTQDASNPSLFRSGGAAASRVELTPIGGGAARPRWATLPAMAAVGLVGIFAVGHLTGTFGPGAHSGPAEHGATGAPSAGAGGPVRTIRVTALDSMTFEPARVDVAAGETVTFVVTNAGRAVHEFTLGDPATQRQHAEAMIGMAGMVHDEPGSLRLQPGETKQLTWRFGAAGTLEYDCHEAGHYEGGMRGVIAVS